MASRRMVRASVIESDKFTDLPLSAQALYMHLLVHGDDDGGLDNAKRITRSIGATPDDLQALIDAGYLIPFESGVIFITHWKVHNQIRKDRYAETLYTKEFSQIVEINAGTDSAIYQLTTSGNQPDNQLTTSGNHSIGKVSKGKVRPGKGSKGDSKGESAAPDGAPPAMDPWEASTASLPLKDKLLEWIDYKKERRFTYKGQGLKSLIKQAESYEQKHGASAVISVIDEAMANGWQGIPWDKIDRVAKSKYAMEGEREERGADAYFAMARDAAMQDNAYSPFFEDQRPDNQEPPTT